MFELTLANWPPIIRVLAESVNEWFFLFGVVHKLTMGFALLGVVNGVFMQETFKVAAQDDTIMVRQKERQVKSHKKKMRKFFLEADDDGSGSMSQDEFVENLSVPALKTWLAAQDLDTSDLKKLFHAIDTGDGNITADELVAGVSRLKGSARSLDMCQVMRDISDVKNWLEVPDNFGSRGERLREEMQVHAEAQRHLKGH
jgi:hypothetical protein